MDVALSEQWTPPHTHTHTNQYDEDPRNKNRYCVKPCTLQSYILLSNVIDLIEVTQNKMYEYIVCSSQPSVSSLHVPPHGLMNICDR